MVVPTLLTGLDDVQEQVERLEVHFLGNAEGDVRFALLSDWSDSPTEHRADDDPILAAARAGMAELNERHGPAQAAAHGSSSFTVRVDGMRAKASGWAGNGSAGSSMSSTSCCAARGTPASSRNRMAWRYPTGVRYVLTLDADTRLPGGSVRRLVGTMAHPLNRPRLDPVTRCVVEGYGVLQPRVTPTLPGRTGSHFQRLSSVSAGIDPYSAAVSDVYQDLFGEGSYTGKGIYDIDAFEAALAGACRRTRC